MSSFGSSFWTCSRCLRAQTLRGTYLDSQSSTFNLRRSRHSFSSTAGAHDERPTETKTVDPSPSIDSPHDGEDQGAMSRRLSEMAEETMDTGSKSDRKLMQDAGFSEELKKQLEERIAQTGSVAPNQRAASQVNMPSSAGKGTRDIAAADPWTGSESLPDAALRMLDDSYKKLRSPYKAPSIPPKVNLRPAPKKNVSAADRLAAARDKTSIYAISQQNDMTEKEREKWRKELKDRFSPGARPMPTSITGLTSLANERIEDAIARGQFKNISRGKGINVERDYNANSPFLDTTEYFMNKIIQKQEIVPPWIEKQQELVKAAATFRGRLRNDWRRHAARMISSRGGSVEDQMRRAKGYALAEEKVNPRPARRVENFSSIASDGSLTTVTIEERIAAGVGVVEEEQDEKHPAPSQQQQQQQVEIKVTEQPAETAPLDASGSGSGSPTTSPSSSSSTMPPSAPPPPPTSPTKPPDSVLPMAHPFRDPAWQATEFGYHTLAVQSLNALTRSYNLMAPKIAQKPYFSLQRELDRCFADVAPTLANEIYERSRRPATKVRTMERKDPQGSGVRGRLGAQEWVGHEGVIRDEGQEKHYGFKQFWREMFGGRGEGKKNVA